MLAVHKTPAVRKAWLTAFQPLRRATLAMAAAAGLALLAGPALAQTAPKVKFVTSEGDFVVEVYPDKAPKTVEIVDRIPRSEATKVSRRQLVEERGG